MLNVSHDANDSGMTVMDCEKVATQQIAAALDGLSHRLAVHGFASNGRSGVQYRRLKDFDEPYTMVLDARLHALEPAWSTRMGAALRHAALFMAVEKTRRRAVVLVTDGEPSDIDVFDSNYLTEDAKHAVDSLASRGVVVHCVSLDQSADAKVTSIFGRRNCVTPMNNRRLTEALDKVLTAVFNR